MVNKLRKGETELAVANIKGTSMQEKEVGDEDEDWMF